MKFDEREKPIFFIGDGLNPTKYIVEEGDEAVLYHGGNLVMAKIYSLEGTQMFGKVTRSVYEADLHPEFTTGKEIRFFKENIFGISKMTKKN